MGLFGKIKNIFYDIEEVEVEKEEEKKETISSPKIEKTSEVKIDPIIDNSTSERELFKTKNTFNFPIFDSDDEEEKKEVKNKVREEEIKRFEIPKREVRRESINIESRSLNINNDKLNNSRDHARKVFVPTPVISPVYGILDKNYKKEEVVPKKEVVEVRKSQTDFDYVRKKAYGTLEDELENTLTSVKPSEEKIESLTEDITETIEKIEESSKNIEDLLNEIETNKISVGELEEKVKFEEEKEKRIDNTLEHDLFNLIDSMYEDKEE